MTLDILTGPDRLTTAWLCDALKDSELLADAELQSFDYQVLSGAKGASSQICRVTLHIDSDGAARNRTLIAKFLVTDPESRDIYHRLGFYMREVNFYRELAPHCHLKVPACYHASYDPDSGHFCLLIADVVQGRNGDRAAGCSIEEAELAIREIAKFHAEWWEAPLLEQQKWIGSFGSPEVLDFEQVVYQKSFGNFVDRMGARLPADIQKLGERFADRVVRVFSDFFTTPITLVHNDYMLDNLILSEAGGERSLVVLDWQFLACGHGALDVASFLGANILTELRREKEPALLRMYHNTLENGGVEGYSFEAFFRDYRYSMFDGLFRMVVAIGGLSLRADQLNAHCDRICPRFLAAITDLDVAELLPS